MAKEYIHPSPFKWRFLSGGFLLASLATLLFLYYHKIWHEKNQSRFLLKMTEKFDTDSAHNSLKYLCWASASTCLLAMAVCYMGEHLEMWDLFGDTVKGYAGLLGFQTVVLLGGTCLFYWVSKRTTSEAMNPVLISTWNNISSTKDGLQIVHNLQVGHNCCGYKNVEDWKKMKWFKDENADKTEREAVYPESCCKESKCSRPFDESRLQNDSCSSYIKNDLLEEFKDNGLGSFCLGFLNVILFSSLLLLIWTRGDEWQSMEEKEDRDEELQAVKEVAIEQEAKKHKKKGSYMFVEETTESASVVEEKLEADPLIKKLPPNYLKQFNISNKSTYAGGGAGAGSTASDHWLSSRLKDFGSEKSFSLRDGLSKESLVSNFESEDLGKSNYEIENR